MKKFHLYILLILICSSCLVAKKETYIFPDAMLTHVQKDYLEMCKKGKSLYALNCATCHNTGRKKHIIPAFSKDQLIGYTLRISNKKHEDAISDSLVTEEELVFIMHFLEYRKK
jgi:hypothetical protein